MYAVTNLKFLQKSEWISSKLYANLRSDVEIEVLRPQYCF